MRRVAVIGNAGGGKSTLSKRIAADIDAPYRAVDQILWAPGWRYRDDFSARHRAWLKEPAWVIDGFGAWGAIEERFAAADAILWIDLPIALHYWWATKRVAKAVVGRDADAPPGCSLARALVPFYRMIWEIHREHRARLALLVETARDQGKAVHVLRSPAQIARFRAGAWKFAAAA